MECLKLDLASRSYYSQRAALKTPTKETNAASSLYYCRKLTRTDFPTVQLFVLGVGSDFLTCYMCSG